MEEIRTLGRSNYQLLIIGRTINQIAKALNQGAEIPTDILNMIQELRQTIKTHTKTVSHAVRASLERWDIG